MPARITATKAATSKKTAKPESKPEIKKVAAPKAKAAAPQQKAAVPAAKPTAAKVAAPKKKASASTAASTVKGTIVSPEEHYRMVAEAAYFIAEKRGFTPGDHAADWALAEAQIANQT